MHHSTTKVAGRPGHARFRERDLEIWDYGNIGNAFANGPHSLGVVSFDVRWLDPEPEPRHYAHPADPSEPDSYALEYWDTEATLEWEAHGPDGFSFKSYPPNKPGRESRKIFAVVGHERSGVFFETGDPP
jgi:hypothetical protein